MILRQIIIISSSSKFTNVFQLQGLKLFLPSAVIKPSVFIDTVASGSGFHALFPNAVDTGTLFHLVIPFLLAVSAVSSSFLISSLRL
jgi:hypothetical protein